MADPRTIGLDRLLRIEWLDAAAGRLAAGHSLKEAREYVWGLLEGVVAGATNSSARGKTLTVLARVWLTPPAAAVALRDSALKLVAAASADERLAIHWAMLVAAYPFFVDVTSLVGKSIGINGEVALSQLTRRLVDTWGDRSTLRPAAQRLVRSLVQWGALRDGEKAGTYLGPSRRIAVPSSISELLVEGLLVAAQRGMSLGQAVNHPALFPFDVRPDLTALRRSERLQVHRHGDQTDFIERVDRPISKPVFEATSTTDSAPPKPQVSASRPKKPKRSQRKGAKATKQLPLFDKPPEDKD